MSRVCRVVDNIWIANITGVLDMFGELRRSGSYKGYSAGDIGILTVCEGPINAACMREFGVSFEARMPPQILYIKAGLNDGPADHDMPYGQPNEAFRYACAVKSIEFLSRVKKMVVVHCWGGVSRSTFVVALYIWHKRGCAFKEALSELKLVYPHTNPHPKHELELDKIAVTLRELS